MPKSNIELLKGHNLREETVTVEFNGYEHEDRCIVETKKKIQAGTDVCYMRIALTFIAYLQFQIFAALKLPQSSGEGLADSEPSS